MENNAPDWGYSLSGDNVFDPRSCEEFQRTEAWILRMIKNAKVKDPRIANDFCKNVNGWAIKTNQQADWFDMWGRHIAGVSYCVPKLAIIGNRPFTVSSMAHELMHAAQGCDASCGTHPHWDTDHIYDAVNMVNFLLPDAGWPE